MAIRWIEKRLMTFTHRTILYTPGGRIVILSAEAGQVLRMPTDSGMKQISFYNPSDEVAGVELDSEGHVLSVLVDGEHIDYFGESTTIRNAEGRFEVQVPQYLIEGQMTPALEDEFA
ncbi:hypothetical protein HGA91_05505 [candidate division WWE3 bacterium]|nr:hypothetical protein [candidate division WWE3 bacterium]